MRAIVTEGKDAEKLDEAIEHLTRSLDPSLWVDDNHVDSDHGQKVFEEEKNAVNKLNERLEDPNSTLSPEILHKYIGFLVGADRMLSQAAIDDAIAQSGDAKDIAKAQDTLVKGDGFLSAGKTESAIEQYRNAWNHALHAIK